MKRRKRIDWIKLLIWIGGIEMVGIVGGLVTAQSVTTWYVTLNKPWFNPPSWIFGPVWTVLYGMLGFVGYVLWREKKESVKAIRKLFMWQLGLNAIWSPVFFGLSSSYLGLLVIGSLWVVLVRLLGRLWQSHRQMVYWLLPYFAWVSFASILNFSIYWLN